MHLSRLASRNGCTYSRYADDLTFSTNKPKFPVCIAERIENHQFKWNPGNELVRLVEKSGFKINSLKTRMQYHDSRQEVTGLVVNRKVNVRGEYRHTVRAMVHRLFTTGNFEFVNRIVDDKGNDITNNNIGTKNQLHGMLGFIDSIDLYNKELNFSSKDSRDHSNFTTKESMYRRFLLFKEFYAASAPVIICEGKTDNVYILHAIRSLSLTCPQLATKNADGTINLLIRIYKYTETSTGRILGINGGTPDLSKFMRLYNNEIKKFKAPGAQHPVILLIDNDAGATEKGKIFNTIKDITKTKVNGTEPFVHVTGNLYVVATPLKPHETQSTIEDFFDQTIKSTIIDGKSFDPKNKSNSSTTYGKTVFAHKVVRKHADKIDFSEFERILSNIILVINAHAEKYSDANSLQ